MRIGLDAYTIGHRGLSAEATLEFARAHGFAGVQFLEPGTIAADLDRGRLADFAARAAALGLYIEVGLPSPNPCRRSRELGRSVDPGEHAAALARQVQAVAALGRRSARAYVGDRHDRFRDDPRWDVQLDATLDVLIQLSAALRESDVKIALETHADLTVAELLALLEPLGPEVAGATVDTGNLAMRLDDPVAAVERLAPWALLTHLKDAVVFRGPRGLRWQARPVGAGVLPMPDLLAPLLRAHPELNLSIELHPRIYDLPTADPTWLAHFPGLRPEALAAIEALADRAEGRFADGTLERPEAIEAIPWADRDLDWLARSLGYLRTLAPALLRLD